MSDDTTFRIERLIDAPPSAVFEAWLSPDAITDWYAVGDDFVVNVVAHDASVGGRYHIEFGPMGAEPCVETGMYLEIDPPHRVVMTMTLANVELPWSDTKVTVVFEEADGKTHLVMVHEGLPSKEHRDAVAGGWPGFIDRLERYAARR